MAISRTVLTILCVLVTGALSAADRASKVAGPYLGLPRPGETPELFAPGVVSGPYDERMAVFAEDGCRLFYQLRGAPVSVIVEMSATGDGWTAPEVAPFSGRYFAEFGVSPDGQTIVLTSDRPLAGGGAPDDEFHAYRVVRLDDGSWSGPEHLGENLDGIGHPSIAENGNLYFFRYHQPGLGVGKADLYVSELGSGGYGPPVNLGIAVNSESYDVDPYIAPDESYIIFASDRKPGGLYISFRLDDGGWTESRHMGRDLAAGDSICPWVTPDGGTLFFTSNRTTARGVPDSPLSYREKRAALDGPGNGSNDIYWVNAAIIDRFRRMLVPELSGPYLGEDLPGTTPEVFAPGIVNTSDHEGCAEFTRSGTRFLFHRLEKGVEEWTDIPVFLMELEDGIWSAPRPAPFESEHQDWDYHFTPDGRWLYFTSMRPVETGGDPPEHGNIWKVGITADGWGEPELVPPPINGPDHHDSSPSLTADGTMYFFSSREGGFGRADVYRSLQINGVYTRPENLGPTINTEHSEYDLVVAPDESFLVFSSTRPGGYGEVDLYVSFRDSGDRWSTPKNLGPEVNATGAVFPSLSDDGKVLFYQSRPDDDGTVYWVSTDVIQDLR